MKKIITSMVVFFVAVSVFSFPVFAESDSFSITVPDYYEKVSDNEWYTDEYVINGDPSEVSITVKFEPSDLTETEIFCDEFLNLVKDKIENLEGFKRFYFEPTIQVTETGYRNIFVSYEEEENGESEHISTHFFYSENQCCTFRFVGSHKIFPITYTSESTLDSVNFEDSFFNEKEEVTILTMEEDVSETKVANQNKKTDDSAEKIILPLVLLPLFGLGGFLIVHAIYWKFDHGKWSKDPQPDLQARIVDFSSKVRSFGRNDERYITRVTFSDGYIFNTAKTKRTEKLFSYTISIDEEMRASIIQKAIETHEKAVKKYLYIHQSMND